MSFTKPRFLPLLFLLAARSGGPAAQSLLQKCAPFLPGDMQKGASALEAYVRCKPVPSHPPSREELLDLLDGIPELSLFGMIFRLFTYRERGDGFDPHTPEGMAELIQALLPPSARKKMPDLQTLMGMMSVLQNLDLSEEDDAGDGTFSAEQTDFLRRHVQ